MNNNPNTWVTAIRQGDFEAAEQDLTSKAAAAVEARAVQHMLAAEEARIDSAYGDAARYVKQEAAQRVRELVAQGRVQSTPQGLVAAYDRAMSESVSEFQSRFREVGDRYNAYTPADAEIKDYISQRKAEQQRLREEGKRIATLPLPR